MNVLKKSLTPPVEWKTGCVAPGKADPAISTNSVSRLYRRLCREIGLPGAERSWCLLLLREIGINAVRYHKAWQIKADFLVLFFVSAGRFPQLAGSPHIRAITAWMADQLPFALTNDDCELLWLQ